MRKKLTQWAITTLVKAVVTKAASIIVKPKPKRSCDLKRIGTTYDTHKFTSNQRTVIRTAEMHRRMRNRQVEQKFRVTQDDLVADLNAEFGINKSATAYRVVWSTDPKEAVKG